MNFFFFFFWKQINRRLHRDKAVAGAGTDFSLWTLLQQWRFLTTPVCSFQSVKIAREVLYKHCESLKMTPACKFCNSDAGQV